MQKRIAITEINGKCGICFKYCLFICRIITITDKMLQYDTRFLGKELSFHSRQAGIKLRGQGTFFRTCHRSC